ncbi:hypothetical protein F53441_3079 [Fusarium austroafricanum]|uniref:WSC domain-containing protein n=1 Tax=Fusarium austroafricanum TaxID=2364996 RepID=A0A8H4KQE1_9HYPO|nr:hypothetical protein F53441_3079 [Fusarium austroafricanum]
MARLNLLYAALFFWVALVAAQSAKLGDLVTQHGCFQGKQPLHFAIAGSSRTEKHRKACFNTCQRKGQPLIAFGTNHCFCADDTPLGIPSLANSHCNVNCLNGLDDNCIKAPEGDAPKGEMLFNVFKILSRPYNEPKIYAMNRGKLRKITAQGCYKGIAGSQLVAHIRISNDETRIECARLCASEGKPLALISRACYCAKAYPHADLAIGDSECHMPCLSKDDERCHRSPMGSYHDFAAYDTGLGVDVEISRKVLFDHEETLEKTSSKLSGTDQPLKQSCYKAAPSKTLSRYFGRKNSPEVCHSFCNRKGSKYAFMIKDYCRCSETPPSTRLELPENMCDVQCPGDSLSTCGGDGAYSMYYLETPDEPTIESQPPKQVARCFWELPTKVDRMVLNLDSVTNVHESCLNGCKSQGKRVAYLQDSQCFCADVYPSWPAAAGRLDCPISCLGDTEYSCGGHGGRQGAFSAYRTGYLGGNYRVESEPVKDRTQPPYWPPMPRRLTSHGCFNMKSTTVTHEKFVGDRNAMGPCFVFCKGENKPVAAVQGGYCLCSETYPVRSARVDDLKCDMKCPGSRFQACGGKDAWSVTNTGVAVKVYSDEPKTGQAPKIEKPETDPSKVETPKMAPQEHGCFKFPNDFYSQQPHTAITGDDLGRKGNYCIKQCLMKEYSFAFRRRNRCFCSHELPEGAEFIKQDQCSFTPMFDGPEMTGGPHWAYSVYRTGYEKVYYPEKEEDKKGDDLRTPATRPQTPEAPKVDKPKTDTSKTERPKLIPEGCFKLHQFSINPPPPGVIGPIRINVGDSCVDHCTEEGYNFAMRFSGMCHCSNNVPEDSKRVDDDDCSFRLGRFQGPEMSGGPGWAYSVYRISSDKSAAPSKPAPEKEEGQKGDNPSTSPVTRPQCPHHGMDRVYETTSWVITKIGEFAQNARDAFGRFVDKAQDVFDACLWQVMVVFYDVMYRLGFVSSDGGIEL